MPKFMRYLNMLCVALPSRRVRGKVVDYMTPVHKYSCSEVWRSDLYGQKKYSRLGELNGSNQTQTVASIVLQCGTQKESF